MKILFISDIHGIVDNLEYIDNLEQKECFDKIVVLGDLYYSGYISNDNIEVNPNKVKDFLNKYNKKIICLRGNCDSDTDIKETNFPICDDLALIHTDGIDIYCTHGNEYNRYKNSKFNSKGVLIYGHEHTPYIDKSEQMIYINNGSISLPRNNSKPSYVIYENKKFTIYSIYEEIIDEIVIN